MKKLKVFFPYFWTHTNTSMSDALKDAYIWVLEQTIVKLTSRPKNYCQYEFENGILTLYPDASFQPWSDDMFRTRITRMPYDRNEDVETKLMNIIKGFFIYEDGTHNANAFNIVMLYFASMLHDHSTDIYLHVLGNATGCMSILSELFRISIRPVKIDIHDPSYYERETRPLAYYGSDMEPNIPPIDVSRFITRPHVFLSYEPLPFVNYADRRIITVPILRIFSKTPDPMNPREADYDPAVIWFPKSPSFRTAFFAILVDFYDRFRDEFGCDMYKVIERFDPELV